MKKEIKQILNKRWDIEFFGELSKTISAFSLTEKIIFYALIGLFVISGIFLLNDVSKSYTLNVPVNGGQLKEGIVGSPRFINPVLAVSDVDHDLTQLVYSGLVKITPENDIVPDLAKDYQISSDGLTYTFDLKDDLYFQDGTKLTTDDVVFTINEIQDGTIKSPLRPEFYDVQVQKIDDKKIQFILKKPYAPFLENLTVGILPKHIWGNLSSEEFPLSQYNLEPVGSGPYEISKMYTTQKDMLLIPTYYELEPFDKYASGKPYIDSLVINFYKDEKSLITAYDNGDIEAINSISPDGMGSVKEQSGAVIKTAPLPKEFMVFFNQNQSEALSYPEVRQALSESVDRNQLVDQVLDGYGIPLYGPIPVGFLGNEQATNTNSYNLADAQALLAKNGWTMSTTTGDLVKKVSKTKTVELSMTLATLNSPNLEEAANLVKANWEKLGAKVDVQEFDFGSLQQNVIRPRKFDALLYGLVVGRDMDFFAFWHSSQRNDPGLNISMYANSKVDKLLEDARATLDQTERTNDYMSFQNDIENDNPAVFLYSPEFTYIVPGNIQNMDINTITMPSERFLNVNEWYIETNNLWKIFAK